MTFHDPPVDLRPWRPRIIAPWALGNLGCYLDPLTPGSVPYKRLAARGSGDRGLGSPKAATLYRSGRTCAGACAGRSGCVRAHVRRGRWRRGDARVTRAPWLVTKDLGRRRGGDRRVTPAPQAEPKAPCDNTCAAGTEFVAARVIRAVRSKESVQRHSVACTVDNSTIQMLTIKCTHVKYPFNSPRPPGVRTGHGGKPCSASATAQPSLFRGAATEAAMAVIYQR